MVDIGYEIRVLEQLCLEDKYSRQGKFELIASALDTKKAEEIRKLIVARIRTLLSLEFWDSKNKRLEILQLNFDIEEVAVAVMAAVAEFDTVTVIQPVINNLSRHMGYLEDFDAIQTAADILNCCSGIFYNLARGESLYLEPFYALKQEVIQQLKDLRCMEPMLVEPRRWNNNYDGGYYTHKTPAVLGGRKTYEGYLALDALNILQTVRTNKGYFVWRYDTRGRMYPTGHENTLYAEDARRSKIRFSKGEKPCKS